MFDDLRSGDLLNSDALNYWLKGDAVQNFGDFLAPYIRHKALLNLIVPTPGYWLIGSVIHKPIIDHAWSILDEDQKRHPLVFWCCGRRDETPLDDRLKALCRFAGVRGPRTRDGLGLPRDTVLGDPGLLLPILYRPKPGAHAGKVVAVPHFYEPLPVDALTEMSGADVILPPRVHGVAELERMIDEIASARLVLAGSLHAAITAFAYDVPFAFWDTGFIDIPFKWQDFSALVNIECRWVGSVAEADGHPLDLSRSLRPTMTSMLGCCPLAVRPGVIARAVAYDARLEPHGARAVSALAQAMDRLSLI